MTSVDVTALLIGAVMDATGVACASQVPADRPERFVQVRSGGGPGVRDIVLDERTVRFGCWAPTDAEAEVLALQVRDALDALEGRRVAGTHILRCRTSTPYPFDDDNSPRYLGQVDVLVRRDLP